MFVLGCSIIIGRSRERQLQQIAPPGTVVLTHRNPPHGEVEQSTHHISARQVTEALTDVMDRRDVRLVILHEFRLGRSAPETATNVNTAWGADTTSERTVRRLFAKFRSGDTAIDHRPGAGRPVRCEVDRLRRTVEARPTSTVRELGGELSVAPQTISRHLAAMGKVKKLDTWVPHHLTEEQRLRRLETCKALQERALREPFLHRILTVDEKWVWYDNRKRKAQWLDPGEPAKQFPKPNLHPQKILVSVWWTAKTVVHYEFLPRGQTINTDVYRRQLDDCHRKLRIKQPALVNRSGPILLHDGARPHVSVRSQQKIRALGYELLPHPAYSPDLAPTDYHMFRQLDRFLRDKEFPNQDAVMHGVSDFFDNCDAAFCRRGIFSLPTRWARCISADGGYFTD